MEERRRRGEGDRVKRVNRKRAGTKERTHISTSRVMVVTPVSLEHKSKKKIAKASINTL